MKASPVVLLPKESYLAMIRNSVGTNLFRNLYAVIDGEKQDILKDSNLSCSFFVSSILHQFNLIALPHATVAGLERDMKSSGWRAVKTLRPGDILIWEPILQYADGKEHSHVGFFIGNDNAISNSNQEKTPIEHHITFGIRPNGSPARVIIAIYTHDFLA